MPILDSDRFAQELEARLEALAIHSEAPGQLTRQYLTPEHRGAIEQVSAWMTRAGMTPRLDAAANLIGRIEGRDRDAQALVMGSHIDTVRDAGRYDGALGIVLPILCIEQLREQGWEPSRALEVVAFGDEEGVRFQSTYLGSRAMAGTFDAALLDATDADGTSFREALKAFGGDPDGLASGASRPASRPAAYLEVHIEQGPVLQAEGLPVGVVTAIAGATRRVVSIQGTAGHAGTVPMALRQDALAAAAQAVLAVETRCQAGGLVGTVGQLEVSPGAVNVIPGAVSFSLDVRSGEDEARQAAVADIEQAITAICTQRGLTCEFRTTHDAASVACDAALSARLAEAVQACGSPVRYLPSGAGHDAAAMAGAAPSAMLFVRCRDGISHHPAEYMAPADGAAAGEVMAHFIQQFDAR